MLIKKIAALEVILQRKHAKMYASLNKDTEVNSSLTAPLGDWYKWQDGQSRVTENLFFDYYRFISFEEARQQCVPATEYSLPLLIDNAGEGYYFSTLNGKVFYNAATFYDKEDLFFTSFESFVDFLLEMAESSAQSIGEFIGIVEALLDKYTR